MGQILILNGSPRAPISNSKRYAQMFAKHWNCQKVYAEITVENHEQLCAEVGRFGDVLLVFPLYVDSLPSGLLSFLKDLERSLGEKRPTISVLVNCGFLESAQNDPAVRMVQLFCQRSGCRFGSVLKIGSGEAILTTPFAFLVERKIRRLARSIAAKRYETLKVSMPLPARLFVSASTRYWIRYGEKNHTTEEEMRTMKIEGQ